MRTSGGGTQHRRSAPGSSPKPDWLLVRQDGGAAFAAAVRRLLTDAALRAAMASNGPRFIVEERNLHQNYRALMWKLQALCDEAVGEDR